MAQTTVIQLFDDLTGEPGDDIENVIFSLDGVTYEIDLAEKNAADLRDRLSEFIAGAKRTGGRRRASSVAPGAKRSPQQLAEVRDWARRAGYPVAAVGRVSQTILDAFDEAQAKPPAEKPRTRRRARR